ncbi:DUF4339 domain-containing protein [Gillisia limnaea]|uniref:GYF domain-containing protein n=1 Tax=Gillisia limnaea (strain DSM 15749 / LMG 21470 / R-8282) TaxID=865937 RepID=H2BVR7_GILLR|nr:DUF4339 domain-containing protein [Gillisia limnaea]EHQ04023.1 hypothetical protein Gilli_3423 [Gillisia limnaea DSM 15749]
MEKLYYLTEGIDKEGPFTLQEINKDKISKNTLVWKKGNKNWLKPNEIPEIKVLISTDSIDEIPQIPNREDPKASSNEVVKRIVIGLIFAVIVKLISYDLIVSNFGGRENMSNHAFSEANTVSYFMAFIGFCLVAVILYFSSKKK